MSTKSSSGWMGGKKPSKDNANAKNATISTRGGSPRGRGGRGRGGGRGASSASALSWGAKSTSGTSTAPAATAITNQRVVDMVEISDDEENTKPTKLKPSTGNNKRKRSSAAMDLDDDDGNEVGEPHLSESSSEEEVEEEAEEEAEDEKGDARKSIPPELLTKLLHEFFENSNTRITRAANEAVAKYVDVFVREAIARAAVERGGGGGGFLEVEDLEKVAPQLLLDL